MMSGENIQYDTFKLLLGVILRYMEYYCLVVLAFLLLIPLSVVSLSVLPNFASGFFGQFSGIALMYAGPAVIDIDGFIKSCSIAAFYLFFFMIVLKLVLAKAFNIIIDIPMKTRILLSFGVISSVYLIALVAVMFNNGPDRVGGYFLMQFYLFSCFVGLIYSFIGGFLGILFKDPDTSKKFPRI